MMECNDYIAEWNNYRNGEMSMPQKGGHDNSGHCPEWWLNSQCSHRAHHHCAFGHM